MIRGLFQDGGFEQMPAAEPNLYMDQANIFLSRIGAHTSPEVVVQFSLGQIEWTGLGLLVLAQDDKRAALVLS